MNIADTVGVIGDGEDEVGPVFCYQLPASQSRIPWYRAGWREGKVQGRRMKEGSLYAGFSSFLSVLNDRSQRID